LQALRDIGTTGSVTIGGAANAFSANAGDSGRGKIGELFNEPGFSGGVQNEYGAEDERDCQCCHLVPLGAKAEDERRGERDGNDGHKGVAIEKRGSRMSEKMATATGTRYKLPRRNVSGARAAQREPSRVVSDSCCDLPCGCFGHKNAMSAATTAESRER